VISAKLGGIPDLKKYMKRVMPFVQATRENMERVGVEALSLALPFDEAAILLDNKQYLLGTLDVSTSMEERERCYSFVLSRTPYETTTGYT
jgi:leucyl-tRNA synthetase